MRHLRHTVAVLGPLVALGLLVALTACSDTAPAVTGPSPATGVPLAEAVTGAARAQHTASVTFDMEISSYADLDTALTGTVEFTPDGVNADLTGVIEYSPDLPTHLIIADGTLYVAGLVELPAGYDWVAVPIGGDRPSGWPVSWVVLDVIEHVLRSSVDPATLGSLAYRSVTGETVDGISVRSALANASIDDLYAGIGDEQFLRYQQEFTPTGARFILYIDDRDLPLRVVTDWTPIVVLPTADIRYSDWGGPGPVVAPTEGVYHA